METILGRKQTADEEGPVMRAELHVREMEALVERQKQMIAAGIADRSERDLAHDVLKTLERSLALAREDLRRRQYIMP